MKIFFLRSKVFGDLLIKIELVVINKNSRISYSLEGLSLTVTFKSVSVPKRNTKIQLYVTTNSI